MDYLSLEIESYEAGYCEQCNTARQFAYAEGVWHCTVCGLDVDQLVTNLVYDDPEIWEDF